MSSSCFVRKVTLGPKSTRKKKKKNTNLVVESEMYVEYDAGMKLKPSV